MNDSANRPRPGTAGLLTFASRLLALCAAVLLPAFGAGRLQAAASPIRFDVFVGYEGIVPEASWFPVVCEIENKGPGFNALVEFSGGDMTHPRLAEMELPTGTTKRLVMPIFSNHSYGNSYRWTARIRDERDKVRAELENVQPKLDWGVPLAAAITRTGSGQPVLPDLGEKELKSKLKFARLLPDLFPDNATALEGLTTIYLNTERALDLKQPQVAALVSWLLNGGHLIVGVDSAGQVTGNEWLRRLFPCEVTGVGTLDRHSEIHQWLVSNRRHDGRTFSTSGNNPYDQAVDARFESASIPIVTCSLRDGQVLFGSEAAPLAVTGRRGRGQITALTFSPEREPFLGWKARPYFWAKMAGLPPELLTSGKPARQAWQSLDGVFGAMIDSKQVRKLPVGWLLLLLVAYLVVIGPLDQFWLKKANRQMLTWITFPAYVACFSVLIYFIGYKLRAGESEWNDLHVVDVMSMGEQAELRGHSYASVYSPANADYPVASDLAIATLRGEFMGNSGEEGSKATVKQKGNTFEGEVTVPVWTSQLFVQEWWRQGPTPLVVTVSSSGLESRVQVDNRTDTRLTNLKLILDGYVTELGEVQAGENKTFAVTRTGRTPLDKWVQRYGASFSTAASQRKQSFGGNQNYLPDVANCSMAASFVSQLGTRPKANDWEPPSGGFVTTSGQDLTPFMARGDAIVMAWAADYAPVKPMNRFTPRRSHRDTLFRVATPVK